MSGSGLESEADRLDDPVAEAAATWWLRSVEDGFSAADQARLDGWLAEDESHRRAYADVLDAMGRFDGVAASDLADLRPAPPAPTERPGIDRRAWMAGGGAIAAGLAVAAVFAGRGPEMELYETGPKGRAVALADGSRLTLDAGSAVEVRLSAHKRDLKLARGQARFEVAHDSARPFSVDIGREVVVATGTIFNIDRLAGRSTVTLLQGGVDIRPTGGGSTTPLKPGQQFISDPSGSRVVVMADPATASAWQAGKLVFENERLADAVDRVNRYAARHLAVADQAAGDLRITGLFDAGDNRAFVEAVTVYLPVVAERRADGVTVLRSKAS